MPSGESNVYSWQRGNKDIHTHTQSHRVFAGGLLPNRGTTLVYYLLLACFARIIYTSNTKGDIRSQNFSMYSEHATSVRAGWVVKSKVLAPVHIAFLLVLDLRFEGYGNEVFLSSYTKAV